MKRIHDIRHVPKKSRLVFIKQTIWKNSANGINHAKALYMCSCGKEKEINIYSVNIGVIQSCGCLQKEIVSKVSKKRMTVHGLSKTLLYKLWVHVKSRCYDKRDQQYHNYGGRGVRMCEEWLINFKVFYDWCTENGWKKGLELDKDIKAYKIGIPALLYSPEMCQFVTSKQNGFYKRTSRYIEYNGKKQTVSEWGEETGIKPATITARLNKNKWSVHTILTTKKIPNR